MGYNTVMVIYNDSVHMGKDDPGLGRRINQSVLMWNGRDRDPNALDVFTCDGRGSASYGRIVSQEHADYTQIVLVGGNSGQRLQDCENLPSDAAYQMIQALEKNGYKVTKRKQNAAGS